MCHFTVNSCCCLSLSTAGYIIASVDLFFHIVRFVYFQEFEFHTDYRLVIELISLLICISWIYGIYSKRRYFLLPYLVLIIITVISLILLVIFLYSIPHHDRYKAARMKQILYENSLLIQSDLFLDKILYSFAVVIGWFVILVMYSLYDSLKEPFAASNMECRYYNAA